LHGESGFYVAIPSYQRVGIIQTKTLALLQKQGVSPNRVYIFVADAVEYEKYRRAIGKDWPNIVIGVRTLWRQRNFITEFFREGTHIVSMDDDLEGLFQCVPCFKQQCLDETQLVELPSGSLALIAEDARKRMVKQQAFLWSVSTSNNPYYMCYRIREKNGLCNGYFWGCLNRRQPELRLRYGDGHEDVERSVRFFNCDGAVLRYCFLCVKTRCKTNSGGLQSLLSQEQRQEEEEKSTQRLVAEFPWLLREVKGSPLGLRFRRGLRSKLMRENLLSSEGMNYLQSQKEGSQGFAAYHWYCGALLIEELLPSFGQR